MTPREIVTKHMSKIRGVRIPELHRLVAAAFEEIEEYDYVIVSRSDLARDPEALRALCCNPTRQNKFR